MFGTLLSASIWRDVSLWSPKERNLNLLEQHRFSLKGFKSKKDKTANFKCSVPQASDGDCERKRFEDHIEEEQREKSSCSV